MKIYWHYQNRISRISGSFCTYVQKVAIASGLTQALPKLQKNRTTIYAADVSVIERFWGKCILLRRHFGLE